MRNDFDRLVIESGQLIRKGKHRLAENAGKAVALITCAVTVLVTFTDVGLRGAFTEATSTDALLLLISSYLMYFSLSDAGRRSAMESEEFLKARAALDGARQAIAGDRVEELRAFCLSYSRQELDFRRRRALWELGLTEEDATSAKSKLTRRQKRALARIKRMKAAPVTPATLLGEGGSREAGELTAPMGARARRTLSSLLPSTVCMIFTVSVMLSAKEGLTAVGVAEGLLKLSCLPIIGLRGYSDGYSLALGAELSWIKAKHRLLEAFLKGAPQGKE